MYFLYFGCCSKRVTRTTRVLSILSDTTTPTIDCFFVCIVLVSIVVMINSRSEMKVRSRDAQRPSLHLHLLSDLLHCFLCLHKRHSVDLKDDATRKYFCDKPLRISLTLTHRNFGSFLCIWSIREYADPYASCFSDVAR